MFNELDGPEAEAWRKETEVRLKMIDEAFDSVFSTADGLIVLGQMLDDLYFMDEARGEGMQALNNYAKAFLKRLSPRITAQAIEAWRRVTSKDVV